MSGNEGLDQQKDCLGCRLVSGFGIIAIGCYIFSQAHKRKKVEGNVMKIISAGAISAGIARLFNMPFLKRSPKSDQA